jgi:prepilin-type N-terminal cleavage/methylation domain-containing protein
MQRLKSGFTLIELLVVIAIIGILSTVVLASLGVARGKGSTAGVRSSLTQLRTEANLYINDNGHYGTALAAGNCAAANTVFSSSKVASIITAMQGMTGYVATCYNTITNPLAWALTTRMKPDGSGNDYICADSVGALKIYSSAQNITGSVCP